MQWYKILARTLLMLSIIDFALAAPVVVQEHQVPVSMVDAARDGTATSPLPRDPGKWPTNAADPTNVSPIPRLSYSGEQEPRQRNPRSQTDSIGSPDLPNPAPPIDVYANNPPSPRTPPGPGYTFASPTDESDSLNPSSSYDDSSPSRLGLSRTEFDSLSFPPPSSQRYKSLSELMSTTPRVTLPQDGSPQMASSPEESHSSSLGSSDRSSTAEYYLGSPDLLSTGESHPPTPGPVDHHPPSNPGLSAEPSPPSSESTVELERVLSKLPKGKFKRRLSGSGAVH